MSELVYLLKRFLVRKISVYSLTLIYNRVIELFNAPYVRVYVRHYIFNKK